MLVRLEQRLNAEVPINLVPSLIVYVDKVLSAASTKYGPAYLILFSTGKEVHPLKTELPIEITLSGMVMLVRLVQLEKA